MDSLLLIIVLIPALSALFSFLNDNRIFLRSVSLISSAVTTGFCIYLMQGESRAYEISFISLIATPDKIKFAALVSFLWFITNIYVIDYLSNNKQGSFYGFFSLTISSAFGVAFASDMLTTFVFYEVMSLVTYPLVSYYQTPEAKKAALIYLFTLFASSMAFFLPAIIAAFCINHSFDFMLLPQQFQALMLLLLIYGVAKAAIFPLHFWLPIAMVAPTPVSALLHAVAVVKSGIFILMQAATQMTPDALPILNYIAGASILYASIMAIKQKKIKGLLAYSTIAQLSYIALAFSLPGGAQVALAHLFAHAFTKISLFFAAGAIAKRAGKTLIEEIKEANMPMTNLILAFGGLAMIGLPLAPTFWTKLALIKLIIENGSIYSLFVIVASTILSAIYFLPVILGCMTPKSSAKTESPPFMLLAMTATTIFSFLLFLINIFD